MNKFTLPLILICTLISNLSGYVCIPCGCEQTWVVEAEYLTWKIKDNPKTPPLVVKSQTVPDGTDTLSLPGAKIVLGDKSKENDWQPGGRFKVGYWFDCWCLGLEANYLFLSVHQNKDCVFSNGQPNSSYLSIPYFDVNSEEETSATLARPGSFKGHAKLAITHRMQSFDLNAIKNLGFISCWQTEVLAGFRYWDFIQRLGFHTESPYIPPFPADIYQTRDKFNVRNNFYGAQLGAKFTRCWDCLVVNAVGKLAFGGLHQVLDIHGRLLTNDFNGYGLPVKYQGGYFAQPSNIGHHHRNVFSVLPEAGINICYQWTHQFRLQIGYSFLFVSNVLWAPKQISDKINPTQSTNLAYVPDPVLSGPPQPKARLKSECFWAQGISAGFSYQY